MIKDLEHFFMCLLAIYIPLVKCLDFPFFSCDVYSLITKL